MSISNPDITTSDLGQCGSASMASDLRISEPLKPIITSSIMPLVNNMDNYQQSGNELRQSQSSGLGLGTGTGTRLTATSYNVIRFHLRSRQSLERIPAGAEIDKSLEMNPRRSDSKSPKKARRSSTPKRSESRSRKLRKAVTSPRQAIAQPRQPITNMEQDRSSRPHLVTPSIEQVNNNNLTLSPVPAEPLDQMVNDEFNEEMVNRSGYASPGSGSGSASTRSWSDSPTYSMDSRGQSDSDFWDNRNFRHATKQRQGMSYDEWLSLKRKQASQRYRQKRREASRLAAAEEMRKEMSEKSYNEWLASKQKLRHHSHLNQLTDQVTQVAGIHQHVPHMQVLSNVRPWRDSNVKSFRTINEPINSKVHQWERHKAIEEDRRRLVKRREMADREAEAEERRRLSKKAWDRWLVQISARSSPNRSHNSIEKKFTQRSNEKVETSKRSGPIGKLSTRKHKNDTVPLSMAQRALRQRLNNMDGVQMYRNRK